MLRAEHEAALRQQIQSLVALKMPLDHPLATEMNETLAGQALLLEEIRIEIHNQLLAAKREKPTLKELETILAGERELDRRAKLENGILA